MWLKAVVCSQNYAEMYLDKKENKYLIKTELNNSAVNKYGNIGEPDVVSLFTDRSGVRT